MGWSGCAHFGSRSQIAQGSAAVSQRETDSQIIPVGRISGVYGVSGWVRIYSFTQPRENIVQYKPWYLRRDNGDWQEAELGQGRAHGKGVVARLADCTDRDQAQLLMGCEIGVPENSLPVLKSGQHYWKDLLGLQVQNTDGEDFGKVDHLLETGANDVLVVKGERERLIPFVMRQVIIEVDLEQGLIRVDWDKDY